MGDLVTVVRTTVTINGRSMLLAQGEDPADLRRRIVTAVQGSGVFVTFTVVGNRPVSVLVQRGIQVVFEEESVLIDPRDTGDQAAPYGGPYDA